MKKITLLSLLLLLASCNVVTSYYQIYETKSETVKLSGSTIAFDDNNCKISYNLWAENGNAGFTFYNKTNEVIYLQMEESFYVINDKAYDYYQNRTFINSSYTASKTTKTTGFTQWGWLSLSSYNSTSLATNSSSGLEIAEPKVIAIPPKTAKSISEFNINETVFRDCDLLRFPSSKETSTKTYSEQTSPIRFYNAITYKIGDKVTKVKNDFYVSGITNVPSKDAFKQEKHAFCNQKGGGTYSVFKDSSPAKFYVRYTKTSLDAWKY